MPDRDDRLEDLVKHVLEISNGFSPHEAAQRLDGITAQDIKRWRRPDQGGWKWMTYAKTRALRRAHGEDVSEEMVVVPEGRDDQLETIDGNGLE